MGLQGELAWFGEAVSAAKKLKALEEAMPPKSWSSLVLRGVNPEFSYPGTQLWLSRIRDALPELIAVLEAAEAVKDHDDNDPRPLRPMLELLYGKVAALDAKLNDAH
jgi:hypothetical protein